MTISEQIKRERNHLMRALVELYVKNYVNGFGITAAGYAAEITKCLNQIKR